MQNKIKKNKTKRKKEKKNRHPQIALFSVSSRFTKDRSLFCSSCVVFFLHAIHFFKKCFQTKLTKESCVYILYLSRPLVLIKIWRQRHGLGKQNGGGGGGGGGGGETKSCNCLFLIHFDSQIPTPNCSFFTPFSHPFFVTPSFGGAQTKTRSFFFVFVPPCSTKHLKPFERFCVVHRTGYFCQTDGKSS